MRITTITLLLGLFSAASVPAQTAAPVSPKRATSAATPAEGMTNQQVIKLVKAGLSDEIVINSIESAAKKAFTLTPDALVDLKSAGVSDRVILAMQSRSGSRTGEPKPATTSPKPESAPEASSMREPRSSSLTRARAAEVLGRLDLFTSVETLTLDGSVNCFNSSSGQFDAKRGETDSQYFSRIQAEILNPSIAQQRSKDTGAINALRSAGLLRSETATGCGRSNQGNVTVLTADGLQASKQWRQLTSSTWEIPMARREIVDVTGLKGDNQAAAVEFTWRWKSLQPGVTTSSPLSRAEAIFEKYDDGWRVNLSRLRFHFYDGWNKLHVSPSYSAAPSSTQTSTTARTTVPLPSPERAAADAVTAAMPVANLLGTWSGDASDSTGPGTVRLRVTAVNGTDWEGTIELADIKSGNQVSVVLKGSYYLGTLKFSAQAPKGTVVRKSGLTRRGQALACDYALEASLTMAGENQMKGVYEATCGQASTKDGQLRLTRDGK